MNEDMKSASTPVPIPNKRPTVGIWFGIALCAVGLIQKHSVHHRANLAYAQGQAAYYISEWLFSLGGLLLILSFCFWMIDGMLKTYRSISNDH